MSDRYPFIAVYIMASRPFGVLYVGVTNNLIRRVYEHREGIIDGFAKKHDCKMLVWFQTFELMTNAIGREHTLKGYSRRWKLDLIESLNADWRDLYPELMDVEQPLHPDLEPFAADIQRARSAKEILTHP